MVALLRGLQQALPKPWLFGLYGAIGGLLGALALGEPLWKLLRPPPPIVVEEPPLRIAASPEVSVFQGGKNRFLVRLARNKFASPVALEVRGAPKGVAIAPATVSENHVDAEVEVAAA